MSEYKNGLVSVVIPTYKRSDLLKRAIDSVLGQTYKNIELLVVNDNEIGDEYSQELYRLIGGYSDERLIFIEQEKHINGAAARNVGIRRAKGEYIAFQDDDDYWEPRKIEIQVAVLEKLDKTYGAVSCLMRIYKDGVLKSAALPYRDGNVLIDILDRRTGMGTGALLIRRDALDDAGYFDEALNRHQDLQLFAYLAEKYKVKLIRTYLHNRETNDPQNRPSAEKIREIKRKYFESISDILERLKPRHRKKVFRMHNFECVKLFWHDGQKKEAAKIVLSVLLNPITAYLALERGVRRVIAIKFKSFLNRRYSAK